MGFAFTPEQRERLFAALGRSDSGAWHLTEDVELALAAYGSVELSADGASNLAAGTSGFQHTLAQVLRLRSELHALPEQARQLAALDAISGDNASDLIRLAHASGEALERLGAKLAALAHAASPRAHPLAASERFVHAVGQAFRNRLNIKPTTDAHGLFRRFLNVLFELVRRRHADLDELSGVLGDARLEQILGLD